MDTKKIILATIVGAAAGAAIGLLLSSKKNRVPIKKLSWKGKDALERLQKTRQSNSYPKKNVGVPTL